MKLALLSDIHSNRQALHACIEHARAQGAQQFALLGDLVGYGADPVAVVEQAMELAHQGALLVQGNHDAMALSPPATPRKHGELGAQWTHAQLGAEHRAFLQSLPLTARWGSVLLVHASADAPEQWRYVEDSDAAERSLNAALAMDPAIRYVFCGHVHVQTLYFLSSTAKLMRFAPVPGVRVPVLAHRQWLGIVGSVGQPRDRDARAMYALFDDVAAQLTFHRLPYDHLAAAAAIRAAGLPAFYAERLASGR
ncbi:metallophosphoesterase family protein [Verminephrobacter eiseniae]|uniref:metallophosphoesterase family protein n=1 Tax=Verminephrobacter eiseniae TaxID=364317 RepID=UPI00223793A5|nr:metallophosphatase family protein [Verminephrobacter eiseniae]MCW5231338.1 metallophosphoesterase [Verminephrobacter eiseniae]MCW5293070.1 metallophosphoesterase [Verminephrobacter eiseniae]MCW8186359.1 metallophosphoesterase [Verminephrobacter eiseniae]MCW8221413.1 metallophosphoesterase [Verminephrobacter eiseniae]MCW8232416.1 metallophosphoesterase [Verminephrobacter eiseniae]